MADKTKLKSDIRKLKSAIASKSTPKTIIPKLKSQLEKAENELANLSKGKKTKSTHASTNATLSKLQTLVKKNKKYSIYKGSSTSNLQKDAERPALPMGKRTSQGLRANGSGSKKANKGHTYYEYRKNRIDVKQPRSKQRYPILEDGGMMAKGGFATDKYKVKVIFKNDDFVEFDEYNTTEKLVKRKINRLYGDKVKSFSIVKKHEDGGMMAKGGINDYSIGKYWVDNEKTNFGYAVKTNRKDRGLATISYHKTKSEANRERDKLNANGSKMADGGMMAKGGEVKKLKIPQTEKEKREVYKLAFGKEYDSTDRKQLPLPIDMATIVAMRKLETDDGYEFYADGGMMAKGGYMKDGGNTLMLTESEYKKVVKKLDEMYGTDVDKDYIHIYDLYNAYTEIPEKDLESNFKSDKDFTIALVDTFEKKGWNVDQPHGKYVVREGYKGGGKLKGNQYKLDVNKNGRLDKEDFKMLRGEKMAKGGSIKVGDIVHLKGSPENRYKVIGEREMFGNKVKAYKVKSLFSDYGGDPKGTESEYSEDQLQKHNRYTKSKGGVMKSGGATKENSGEELNLGSSKTRTTSEELEKLGYKRTNGSWITRSSSNKNNYVAYKKRNSDYVYEFEILTNGKLKPFHQFVQKGK